MKKSLNKVIVTLAAVTALTAAMAVTASAAVETSQVTDTDGKTTVTANVTGKTANEQVTMLVLKPTADTTDGIQEDEIAYIDQKAADADGKVTFTMPIGTTTKGDKYELLSGSTSATEADTGEIVIPADDTAIHYGDVTGDDKINGSDSMQVLLYTVNKGQIVGNDEKFARADVTRDDKVNGSDSMQILLYTVNKGQIVTNGLDSWMTK